MDTMAVALFSDRPRAEHIRQRLVEAGFAAIIKEECTLQKLWFVSRQDAGLSLEVPADQFEGAAQKLVSWAVEERVPDHVIRCPECGSFRVDFPQFTRRSLLTNVVMGLAAGIGILEKDYYCEDCHYTWPKEGQATLQTRPHMAPYYFIEGMEQIKVQPVQPCTEPPRKSV